MTYITAYNFHLIYRNFILTNLYLYIFIFNIYHILYL